jgi:hypothetical protein
MRRLFSKVAAWVIYRTFIYFSRHVSYPDFRIIWEQAYQASVEAEWSRMRMLNLPPSSMPINLRLVEQAGEVGQRQSEQQSEPTSPRLDSGDGQGERPQPSQLMSKSQRMRLKAQSKEE